MANYLKIRDEAFNNLLQAVSNDRVEAKKLLTNYAINSNNNNSSKYKKNLAKACIDAIRSMNPDATDKDLKDMALVLIDVALDYKPENESEGNGTEGNGTEVLSTEGNETEGNETEVPSTEGDGTIPPKAIGGRRRRRRHRTKKARKGRKSRKSKKNQN